MSDLDDWLDDDEAEQALVTPPLNNDTPPANTDNITLRPGPRLDMLTAKLAMEFAAGLLSANEIKDHFNLTGAQVVTITSSTAFRELYADAKLATGGGLETTARGRLKADMVIEDGLIQMHAIIQDAGSSSQNATDAFRAVTAISSHASKNRAGEGEGDATKGFTLNISLHGNTPTTVIEGEVKQVAEEGS